MPDPIKSALARSRRARTHGRNRAKYWAALGHPNLVKARAASLISRARKRLERELAAKQDDD